MSILITGTLIFLGLRIAEAQIASQTAQRLTVMVTGVESRAQGTGMIFGNSTHEVYVVTAAHVVGPRGSRVLTQLFPEFRQTYLQCEVLISGGTSDQLPTSAPRDATVDLAVLRCPLMGPLKRRHFFYDVAGEPKELRRGAPLMLIGNLARKWEVPLTFFPLERVVASGTPAVIDFLNPLHLDLQGASGGPLLTDRSELVGLQFEQRRREPANIKAYTWHFVREWIRNSAQGVPINLARRARSAPALRRGNVELSIAMASVFVPNFGWLPPAPKLRIGSPLPNLESVALSFDFTFSQSTKIANGSEKLSITVPAVTAEWQLGSYWGPLRRRELLGGLYLAGGVAPIVLQSRSLTQTREQADIRSWAAIFDAGWRYRLPGRALGFTASYREGVLLDSSARTLYPRFQALSCGVFVVLFR